MSFNKHLRKQLRHQLLLHESLTTHVGDFNYENNYDDISDVNEYLNKMVNKEIVNLVGNDKFNDYHNYGYFVNYDGDTLPYDNQGTLNFYGHNMPDKLLYYLSQQCVKWLTKINIQSEISNIEQSNSRDESVVRINIKPMPETNKPIEINMSNDNAQFIFCEILQYSKNEFKTNVYDNKGFNVDDLKKRVDFAQNNMDILNGRDSINKKNIYDPGLKKDEIMNRLNKLKELINYCLLNKNNTIYLS